MNLSNDVGVTKKVGVIALVVVNVIYVFNGKLSTLVANSVN